MSEGSTSTTPPIPPPGVIDFPGFSITAQDTVVDIGCGDGLVCEYAGRVGADVIGVDIEDVLIKQTTERMRNVPARSFRGIITDCAPIPLPEGTATKVICAEVMEHVPDPAAFLKELARIGAPGALYLFSVPAEGVERVMHAMAPKWYGQPPIHIHIYSKDQFLSLIRASGLEIAVVTNWGFYMSFWWIIRMAIGMEKPYDPTPDHPAFPALDVVANTIVYSKHGGGAALRLFEDQLPKKLVVVARKPEPGTQSSGGAFFTWLKNTFRFGKVKMGNYQLTWTIKRT